MTEVAGEDEVAVRSAGGVTSQKNLSLREVSEEVSEGANCRPVYSHS